MLDEKTRCGTAAVRKIKKLNNTNNRKSLLYHKLSEVFLRTAVKAVNNALKP